MHAHTKSDGNPWYADGLRFRCTRCGQCCTGEPGNVWVDGAEIEALARRLGESEEEFLALRTRLGARGRTLREKANGDCLFYENGTGCTVYDLRPRQCRTWPFWSSNVRDEAAWEATCRVCPGSGQGDLISAEEISRRVRVIPI